MKNKKMEQAGFVELDKKHLKNILDNGFSYVEISPGNIVKITADDLAFDADEIHAYEKSPEFKQYKERIANEKG